MKKFLALVMAAIMLLSVCSFASAEDGKIHLVFQYSFEENFREPFLAIIDRFMAENPDIVVESVYGGSYNESNQKLLAAHAAAMQGDKSGYPSVQQTIGNSIAAFAEGGVIAPLNDLMPAANFQLDQYFTGMIDAYSYDGQVYGIPGFVSVCPTLYYNKTITNELNAPIPTKWDEMEAWLEKVTVKDETGKTVRYGLSIAAWSADYLTSLFWQNGCEMFADEDQSAVAFNSPEFIETANMLKKWVDMGYVKWCYGTNASGNMRQSFMDGTSVAVTHTCALYKDYLNAFQPKNWEIGVAFPPSQTKSIAQMGGSGLTVMSQLTPEEKEAAFKLVAYLTNGDSNMVIAQATGYMPVSNLALESDACKEWVGANPELQNLYDHLPEVVGAPVNPAWSQLGSKLCDALGLIMIEGADAEAALNDLADECNEILEDQ